MKKKQIKSKLFLNKKKITELNNPESTLGGISGITFINSCAGSCKSDCICVTDRCWVHSIDSCPGAPRPSIDQRCITGQNSTFVCPTLP